MKLKYQIAVVATALALIVGPIILSRQPPEFVRKFFAAVTSPLNLAIFRIVLFTFVLFSFSIESVRWFSSLPVELQFPPSGLGAALKIIPINESLGLIAAVGLIVFCLTSALGLFTRVSTVVCVILSLYVLGIPQLFGKINHYHHLIWFMAILAVSPCSDVLSIDGIFASWKRADRGVTDPPGPSVAYALPLRFVWLLMGIIYLSAGIWKVWTAGYKWAWSDNPRNLMYNKWMELSGWRPLFRIDHYPLLYKLSAVATIFFELSFIFLILFASVRILAPLGGLFFHNMTNLFMRISFLGLQVCYVTFVDWQRLFRFIGEKLFPRPLNIIYDGNCKLCRRTIASIRTVDVLERTVYINGLDEQALQEAKLAWLDHDALLKDMHAVIGDKTWHGFYSYRVWLQRIPLFWPILPFLYLWPVSSIGQSIYRRVADSRLCSLVDRVETSNFVTRTASITLVVVIGYILCFSATVASVAKLQSWPFAGYPTFEDIDEPEVGVLTMVVDGPNGTSTEITPIREQRLPAIPPERLMGMLSSILAVENESDRRVRLTAFWKVWTVDDVQLKNAVRVRFYMDTLSSLPERSESNLIRRDLVYDFTPPRN